MGKKGSSGTARSLVERLSVFNSVKILLLKFHAAIVNIMGSLKKGLIFSSSSLPKIDVCKKRLSGYDGEFFMLTQPKLVLTLHLFQKA